MPVAFLTELPFGAVVSWTHQLPVIWLLDCCIIINSLASFCPLVYHSSFCIGIKGIAALFSTQQYSVLRKANRIMSNTMRCTLVVCVALALFAAGCNVEASKTRPPRNNEISTMADAIKYLQDLDVYYGDRARVRFGKRGSLMQALRNRILENGNNNENINEFNHGADFIHAAAEEEPF